MAIFPTKRRANEQPGGGLAPTRPLFSPSIFLVVHGSHGFWTGILRGDVRISKMKGHGVVDVYIYAW